MMLSDILSHAQDEDLVKQNVHFYFFQQNNFVLEKSILVIVIFICFIMNTIIGGAFSSVTTVKKGLSQNKLETAPFLNQ